MGYPASKRENRGAKSPAQQRSEAHETHERKRIPVACTRCRKRKIKCTGDTGGGCDNCKTVSEDCFFSRVGSAIPVQFVGSSVPGPYSQVPQFLSVGLNHQQAPNCPPGVFASIPVHPNHPYGIYAGVQPQEFPHQQTPSRQPSMQSISYGYNDSESENFSISTYTGGPLTSQTSSSTHLPYSDGQHSNISITRDSSISSDSNRVISNSYSSTSSGQSSFNDRHLPIPGLNKKVYGSVPMEPVKCMYTSSGPVYADYNMGTGYLFPQTQSHLPHSPNYSPMTKPFSNGHFLPQYSYSAAGIPVHRKASVPSPTVSTQSSNGYIQLPSMAAEIPSCSSTGLTRDYGSISSSAQQTPELQHPSQPILPSNVPPQYHQNQNYQRGDHGSSNSSMLCSGRTYVPFGVHMDGVGGQTQASSPTARLIPCPRQIQRKSRLENNGNTPTIEAE